MAAINLAYLMGFKVLVNGVGSPILSHLTANKSLAHAFGLHCFDLYVREVPELPPLDRSLLHRSSVNHYKYVELSNHTIFSTYFVTY